MPHGPPLVVPGAALLRVIWLLGSQTNAFNIYGVSVGSATINQALANTLDAAVKSAFTSNITARIHPSVSLQAIGIRHIGSPNLVEYVGAGAPVVGTGTGDPLPRGVALCVTLRTARAGAAYRGRSFIPGWCESDNETDATATAVAGTQAVAYVTAIGAALASSGMALAVVSRPAYATTTTKDIIVPGGETQTVVRNTAARPGALNVVTAITARNDVWDSQRRRTSAGSQSTLFRQAVAASHAEDGQWDASNVLVWTDQTKSRTSAASSR